MRLRKADHDLLAAMETMGGIDDLLSPNQKKAWSSFLQRVGNEGMKKANKVTAYPVRDAISVIRETLGRRHAPPAGNPPPVFFITLQAVITRSGLTANLCKQAAQAAMKEWDGFIKADSVIRQADKLLAGSQLPDVPIKQKRLKSWGDDDLVDL